MTDSYADWEARKNPPKGWVEYGECQDAPYGLFYSTELAPDDGLPLWQRPIRLDDLPTGQRLHRSAKEDVKPKKPAPVPEIDEYGYGRLEDEMLNGREPRI